MNQDESVDLFAYAQICESIRQTMSKVVDLKNGKVDEPNADITELRMEGSFDFLNLKQLNRAAQIRCKQVKDQTLEAKQKLDGYNLQLENLQYEITHLQKEITKCLEFRSRHDDISLIPLQDFYESAPPEISNPKTTKSNIHKQTLARLDFELEQRKELADDLERLKKLRENLAKEISDKKQNLQTLAPALENLLKTSLPLQEIFNLPIDHTKQQNDLACLLPRPLFVLFLQAKGYQEACDPLMSVSINGDADQAKKLKERSQSAKLVSGLTTEKEDSDSELEEMEDQDSRHSHRRKKEKASAMEHDGVDDVTGVFACHPLAVGMDLLVKEDGPSLQLTFTYLTNLNLVTVLGELKFPQQSSDKELEQSSLLNDTNLLCCSLKDDFGLSSPNHSTAHLLLKSNVQLSSIFSTIGRPYRWAQNIGGLVFLPEKLPIAGEDMQLSFNHIQATIKALREKVISRMSLARKIDEFSNNTLSYNGPQIVELPNKIHCGLTSWSAIAYSDYKKLSYAQNVVQLGLLGNEEEAKCHDYFIASIERGSAAKLEAAFAVFCDYPNTLPLVTLALQWNGLKTAENDQNIREIECELNVGWPDSVGGCHEIIALQLKRLMVMLDLYVETESDRDDDVGAEFPLSKICPLKTKGPARIKPYWYQSTTKSFAHRRPNDV